MQSSQRYPNNRLKRRTPSGVNWRMFLVQSLLNSVVPFTLIAWTEQTVDAGLATILNSALP